MSEVISLVIGFPLPSILNAAAVSAGYTDTDANHTALAPVVPVAGLADSDAPHLYMAVARYAEHISRVGRTERIGRTNPETSVSPQDNDVLSQRQIQHRHPHSSDDHGKYGGIAFGIERGEETFHLTHAALVVLANAMTSPGFRPMSRSKWTVTEIMPLRSRRTWLIRPDIRAQQRSAAGNGRCNTLG